MILLVILWMAAGCTPQEDDAAETVEIEFEEGTNMMATLSPAADELLLAIQGALWLIPPEGGEAERITDPVQDADEPAWSPDGGQIAFHSYREGRFSIWLMNRDGTGLEQLTPGGPGDDREPHWTPDGETILFSSDREGSYDLWSLDLSSSRKVRLTDGDGDDAHPAPEPEGDRIAFVSNRDGGNLWILEQGEMRPLADLPLRPVSPSWSPDGSRIHVTGYGRGVSRHYLVDVESGDVAELSGSGDDLFPFRVSWTSDREFLYTGDGRIWRFDLDTGDRSEVPFRATLRFHRPERAERDRPFDERAERPVQGILSPSLSPDGERIVFTALGDLYLKEVNGALLQITGDRWVNLDPDWSPDGEQIVFTSDREGERQLWIYHTATGEMELASPYHERVSSPSWSHDGRSIAFLEQSDRNLWGAAQLMVLDLETGETESVYDPLFAPGKPAWSADDRTIAMMALDRRNSRFREGYNRILMISMDDFSARMISPHEEASMGTRIGSGPVWSPDGEALYYVKSGRLWRWPLTSDMESGGDPQVIADELSHFPSISADGSRISYLATDRLVRKETDGSDRVEIDPGLSWEADLPTREVTLHAGRLYDGTGDTYRENVDIVIRDNRIVAVEDHDPDRQGERIDASDRVVMPGLMEMHSHQNTMEGEMLGRLWLSYGITTVREPGGDPYDALERKESWESGVRPGPRLFFTGALQDGDRIFYGHNEPLADERHRRWELERAGVLGYDLLKTYVRMPDSLQQELTEFAHELGIPVSSHELYPAVIFGVDSVEHLRGTSRRGYSLKQTALNRSYEDVVNTLAGTGMNVTPTIVMHGGYLRMMEDDDRLMEHPQIRAFFSESYREMYRERARQSEYGRAFGGEEDTEPGAIQDAAFRIVRSGGVVTAGTDSPFVPLGSSLHAELWLYVDGGLDPHEALQTATSDAAAALGVGDDLGRVEPGYLADLVIVDGDPLSDIRDAMNVERVMRGGILYTLEELLER